MEIRAHRDKWRIKANVDESTGKSPNVQPQCSNRLEHFGSPFT